MIRRMTRAITPLLLILAAGVMVAATSSIASAQVTFDRILNAKKEPQNWLTYS
jgi:hypothetical protein